MWDEAPADLADAFAHAWPEPESPQPPPSPEPRAWGWHRSQPSLDAPWSTRRPAYSQPERPQSLSAEDPPSLPQPPQTAKAGGAPDSTPSVRPADTAPTSPPMWQGQMGADISPKTPGIIIHRPESKERYLTSVGGRPAVALHEADVAAMTGLPATELRSLAAQFKPDQVASSLLQGAAAGPAASAASLPAAAPRPRADHQTSPNIGTHSLTPPPARPQAPAPGPRLEWTQQRMADRDELEQKLAVAGHWRVEDLPAFLQDPMLRQAPPQQRLQLLNDVLTQAGREYAQRPGYGQKQYLDYHAVAEAARERVQEMKTWGETAAGAGGFAVDIGTGIARGAIATATDATITRPGAFLDPEKSAFRLPFGNVFQQAGHWFDKAGDTADRVLSWGADKEVDSTLADLQKDLATGNLPLGDRPALDAWLTAYSRRLSAAQAAWYEAVQGTEGKITHHGQTQVMDKPWLQAYAQTNSLEAPHNAALLAEYLHTRDPQALARLTESLKKTPQRAQAERAQHQNLEKSEVVSFLNQTTSADYAQVMADAGNPLEIASNLVPIIRGARAASKTGSTLLGKIRSAAGSVAGELALEATNLAVENPDAQLADYLATGRDAVAIALGLHGTGVAAGKLAQHLTPPGSPTPAPQPAAPAPAAPAPTSGQATPPAGGPPPAIPWAPSEFNPQVISEAPGTPPASPPPQVHSPIPPLWQGTARHGEAAEVLRHNEDGTYQVRRNGGPEETFQEAQVAAMTGMQKPALHAHMAQALADQRRRLETIRSEQRLPADAGEPRPSFLRLADEDHGSNFGHERSGTERTYPKREDRDPGRALESLRQSAAGQRSASPGQTVGKTDRPRPDSPIDRLQPLDAEALRSGIVSLERRKGDEHDVRFDPASNTVIKLTRPGEFGSEKLGLDGYLQRLAWANELFGDRIRVEGIVHLPGEKSSRVVTTQPWYRADESRSQPTQREIDIYMRKKGFLKAYDGAYLHESRDIVASDAVPKNFVRDVEGHLHPVDVVLVEPSATQYERLENQAYNLPQISLDTP